MDFEIIKIEDYTLIHVLNDRPGENNTSDLKTEQVRVRVNGKSLI